MEGKMMNRNRGLKAKHFYWVWLLIIGIFLYPLTLLGQGNPSKVEVKNGLVTVDVKDVDVGEVLREIERGTGIKITISNDLVGQKITTKFADLDPETALQDILDKAKSYFVFTLTQDTGDPKKENLKEIKADGNIFGKKPYKGKITAIYIPYGEGEKEVEAEPVVNIGPSSFNVDDEGNIYICDKLQGRVQVYSPTGAYLYTIPMKGHPIRRDATSIVYDKVIQDVAVDKHGFVYIYDNYGRLFQYDKKGNVIKFFSVENVKQNWQVVGGLQVIDDEIYIGISASNYAIDDGLLVIGRILPDKTLVPPSDEEKKNPKLKMKRFGLITGKEYSGKALKASGGLRIETKIKPKNAGTVKLISFPFEGIISCQNIGEDNKGNFYLRTDRNDENRQLVVEVHKISSEGEYVSTLGFPRERFHYSPLKIDSLSRDGTIYDFRPTKERLRITIFHAE
jgi:hypothetical protein